MRNAKHRKQSGLVLIEAQPRDQFCSNSSNTSLSTRQCTIQQKQSSTRALPTLNRTYGETYHSKEGAWMPSVMNFRWFRTPAGGTESGVARGRSPRKSGMGRYRDINWNRHDNCSVDDNRAMHSSIYSDRSIPRVLGTTHPETPFRISSAFATDYEGLSVILAALDNLYVVELPDIQILTR